MYVIALFGILMMLLSIIMIANPEYWAKGIVKFSQKFYFHPLEIITRLVFGILFLVFAESTLFPDVMRIVGYMLCGVGVGLILTPPSKHRQFALWSANKFKSTFRIAGITSLFFSAFLVYAAIGSLLK